MKNDDEGRAWLQKYEGRKAAHGTVDSGSGNDNQQTTAQGASQEERTAEDGMQVEGTATPRPDDGRADELTGHATGDQTRRS